MSESTNPALLKKVDLVVGVDGGRWWCSSISRQRLPFMMKSIA